MGYVTVSAKIPRRLKELLDKYGIKPGPVIRRGFSSHIGLYNLMCFHHFISIPLHPAHVIIGVVALEQMGYRVDPVTGKLVRGHHSCSNELFKSLYMGS